MSEWNRICEESIRREKKEAEAKYGIKIGQTEIYCAVCGKKWDFAGNNGCKGAVAHVDTLPGKSLLLGHRRGHLNGSEGYSEEV